MRITLILQRYGASGGAENLYFGGGLGRLLDRAALFLFPPLRLRMKRLIVAFQSTKRG